MSKLKELLQSDLKTAMKTKNTIKRDTIRFLMSALKQVEVDQRIELSDKDIIKIIQKSVKQREDSMTQYENAGRNDLFQKELAEAKILKEYLPAQLDDNELKDIVKEAIKEVNASSMKDIGKVMGLAIKKSSGKADGKRINSIVKILLN
jgi:uncharacterized protein YqeY